MIEIVNAEAVDAFQRIDHIGQMLDQCSAPADEAMTCQRWLREAPVKRYIYQRLYGDLLTSAQRQRCLDVGGGLTSLTAALAKRHDYTLIDLFAHDDQAALERLRRTAPFAVHLDDWHDVAVDGVFDIVVANDLFPNVDQRLELFLRRFLPLTKRIRMSLTYYPEPRFYRTRRVDSSEFLCMLAWDGVLTARTLSAFTDRLEGGKWELLEAPAPASLYANGRQVCLVELRGDLANE